MFTLTLRLLWALTWQRVVTNCTSLPFAFFTEGFFFWLLNTADLQSQSRPSAMLSTLSCWKPHLLSCNLTWSLCQRQPHIFNPDLSGFSSTFPTSWRGIFSLISCTISSIVCCFFIFILFLAVLGSNCSSQDISLWCTGSSLQRAAFSLVEACGLSCPTACGIFPDQELNFHSLHWQMDSSSLDHWGSSSSLVL